MVKRRLLFIALVAPIAFVLTVTAREITELQITSVGQSRGDDDGFAERNCKAFAPTQAQLRHYFKQAYPVELHFAIDLRYSACYATGHITFDDGNRGTWNISSSGSGSINWSDGSHIPIFYKHNKWLDPFACGYSMGDDPEC